MISRLNNTIAAYSGKIRTGIYILVFILLGNVSFAQEGLLTIKGVIHDERGETLPFTSVALLHPETGTKPVKGILSNDKGEFTLAIQAGSYRIQISMVGYKPYTKDINLSADTDLGNITLSTDAKILGEVKVTAAKPLITRKVDRYVLNVSGSVLSSGRGTFELMNYAPGVMTIGNAISINGNTATKVMVNGRLLRLSGDQVQNYLVNLRSEDVESIEVIPNPGAEYEAEGGGGLINIVLKKQHAGGFDGSVSLGALTPKMPSYNTSEQFNYGYKGLQLYGSHNYTKRKAVANLEDFRSQEDLTYQTKVNTTTASNANSYRAGAAYDISKNQYAGIEFNGNANRSNSTSLSEALLSDPSNNRFNRINGDFLTRSNSRIYTLSFNYNLKIDTLGSAFNIVADYTHSDGKGSGDFHSHYSNLQNVSLFDSIYRNTVPVNVKNYNAAANYIKSFKNSSQLKFGAKYTETNTKNDVSYEYFKNNQFINDPERSNAFAYKEKITAVYAQYSFDWGKTKIQVGLRGENTATEGASVTSAQSTSRNYFNLFPSAFLRRQFNDKNTLSFSYRRRLDRPSFNSLNPFEWRVDDYTYISGNPYLKPQFTNSFNLAYSFLNKYDLTFFASQTHGVFAQYLTANDPNSVVANYSWENLSSQDYLGANLYIPVTVAKWWSMVNNLMVYRNTIEFEAGQSRKTIFMGKTTQNITVKNSLRFELSGLYMSRYNTSNQIFVPSYYADLGLSDSFFNKKLTVRTLLTDVFNTSKNDYETISGNLNLTEKQKYTTRRFSLQLIYNFSLGKKVKVQKIESGNSDEKNRM